MIPEWTLDELFAFAAVQDFDDVALAKLRRMVDTIGMRGLGNSIAVYQNMDMGHPDLGMAQFVTVGPHPDNQIVLDADGGQGAPTKMPDIGNAINWRYQLIALYGGD